MESLQDKVAVITGAASGIGRASALALANRGSRVVIADIDADQAGVVAEEINRSGGQAVAVRCDVSTESAFDELKTFTLDRFGGVDVVMNNVGVLTHGRPEDVTVDEWRRVFEVNVFSVARSNAAFLPLLIDQGHGHLVNTASFAGLFTYSYDRMPYAASKAAIVQISEGLRLYLHPQGIGVTVLCPGPVWTNLGGTLPTTFDTKLAVRGPGEQFDLLDATTVGEQVADAILDDTFMLYTHEHVREVLVERASDWNTFIAEQEVRMGISNGLPTR